MLMPGAMTCARLMAFLSVAILPAIHKEALGDGQVEDEGCGGA